MGMKAVTGSILIALALVTIPPASAKPRRVKAVAVKKKPAKVAAPKTPTQMLAPPAPEGPADLPVAAADLAVRTPIARPAAANSAAIRRDGSEAAVGGAALSPVQAACQGSQGQNVAIPDGLGSQTTRCGVNASLGRTDMRVDYRVRPLAPR